MYFLQPGNFSYLVWQYGPRFMRICFTQFVSGNVERANRGLRLRSHLTLWRQRIDKKKRDVMRGNTFITGYGGKKMLWAESSRAVRACSGVARHWCPRPAITMAARNRNYKFQKPHIAHATAICRNPPIHTFTLERKKLHQSSADQHFSIIHFLLKYKDEQFFCGHNILKEGLFVTEMFRAAGISVHPVVCVTTNCCVTSDSYTESNCIWLSILKFVKRRKYFIYNFHFAVQFVNPSTLLPRVVITLLLSSLPT